MSRNQMFLKHARIRIDSSQELQDVVHVPLRIPVGEKNVLLLHQIKCSVGFAGATDTGLFQFNIGMSYRDLANEVVTTPAPAINPAGRTDLFAWFPFIFNVPVTNQTTIQFPEKSLDYGNFPLKLPRSPTVFLFPAAMGTNDNVDIDVDIMVYYTKMKEDSNTIIKLLKQYIAQRAQQPARVIDETVKTPDATADVFGNIPPQQD